MKKKSFTNAQYRETKIQEHQNNPLITALPNYIEPGRLKQLLKFIPAIPNTEFMDKSDRIKLVKRIRKINIPTKKFIDFYSAIYNLIIVGYEERNPLDSDVVQFHYDIADPTISVADLKAQGKVIECDEDTTTEHLFLAGISGIGKTAIKNSVFKSLLPGVLVHTRDDFDEIQVISIHAQMPHDGSRATLLKNLFEALDNALKPVEETNYLEQVQPKLDRSASIGAMERFFKSLCLKYHIGIIVIDEFQNIDVASSDNKNHMRQLFDTMSNDLNVPFLKIGTSDSLKHFKTKFQHGRRAGDTIEIESYPRVPNYPKLDREKNKRVYSLGKDWNHLAESVFDFQVIKKPVAYSERWDLELHKLTCGIPYVLFTLWQEAQIDAIRTGKETITLRQLNEVYRRRFKLIKTALTALKTKRLGQFQDLLTIAQLFDKNEVDAAIKRLNHFVNSENFSGAAATDILKSVDEIERENSFTAQQKSKTNQLRSLLKQRSRAVKAGQTYENEAKQDASN